MLSIRNVKNLNHGKLRGALSYACRPSRPEGAPKLKALYVFGSKEAATPALPSPCSAQKAIGAGLNQNSQKHSTSSQDEADPWWSRRGQVLNKPLSEDWARCLQACQGIISFDAVLCQGPRHRTSPAFGRTPLLANCGPAVATFAVGGCASCGKAPEGMCQETSDLMSLPLLSPPPILSSSIRAATLPPQPNSSFVPRCTDCLRERYCPCCSKWWCESCYQLPGDTLHDDHLVIVDYDESWNSLDHHMEPQFTSTKAKVRRGFCETCTNGAEQEPSTKGASSVK